jgi:hypothetical protein
MLGRHAAVVNGRLRSVAKQAIFVQRCRQHPEVLVPRELAQTAPGLRISLVRRGGAPALPPRKQQHYELRRSASPAPPSTGVSAIVENATFCAPVGLWRADEYLGRRRLSRGPAPGPEDALWQ